MATQNYKFLLGASITSTNASGGGGGTINGTIQATQVAYGTATDTIGGENEFVYDDTNNVLTVEKLDGQVILKIRNESGSTIQAGTAVYISGSHSSGRPLINLALASDSTKMPSAVIVANQIPTGSNGFGILTGQLNGLDGSVGNTVFDQTLTVADIGKTVYVSPINSGRLTIVKPNTNATYLIQNIGRILDFSGGSAKIEVNNIGRTNDVPNQFSTIGNINAGSLTVNSAYSFPTSDGSNGQILVTNGSGSLTFQNNTSTIVSGLIKIADETLSSGDIVRIVQNGESPLIEGRVIKAVATSIYAEDVFICLNSATQGNNVSIALIGEISIATSSVLATTDNGKILYLSSTTGQATLTPPSSSGTNVIKLGTLTGADGVTSTPSVIFRPQYIMYNA